MTAPVIILKNQQAILRPLIEFSVPDVMEYMHITHPELPMKSTQAGALQSL